MTEEEAKVKLCHMTFGSEDSGPCVASVCMAWRWLPLMADEAFKNAVIKAADEIGDKTETKMKATKHVMANRANYGLPDQPFDGYCGLAGKP